MIFKIDTELGRKIKRILNELLMEPELIIVKEDNACCQNCNSSCSNDCVSSCWGSCGDEGK